MNGTATTQPETRANGWHGLSGRRAFAPRALVFALVWLAVPAAARADAVSPLLNLFHRESWQPATIVTVVIILIESAILRWRLRPLSFARAFLGSLVINIASSAAGSILLLAFNADTYFVWDAMFLVMPLFLITLFTEIPLLRFFYRRPPTNLGWERACALGIGLNVASYAAVFALELGFFFVCLAYAGHLDEKESKEWRNPELVRRMQGSIYAAEVRTGFGYGYGLRVFDPRTATWTSLTNGPPVRLSAWDVSGDVCAFVGEANTNHSDRYVAVCRLPDFATLREIELAPLFDTACEGNDNRQSVSELALSPDGRRLAILLAYGDAVAPKNAQGYYSLGSKCRLLVLDVAAGREPLRAPRRASGDGLCWLPDSQTVLFASFDDEKLYDPTACDVQGNVGWGIGYAREGDFSRGLYAFDPEQGTCRRFSNGRDASLALNAGMVLVRDDDTLRLLDSTGRETRATTISRLGYGAVVISPDGTMILAQIMRHSPFFGAGTPTVLDLTEPATRHILLTDATPRFVWTITRAAAESRPK